MKLQGFRALLSSSFSSCNCKLTACTTILVSLIVLAGCKRDDMAEQEKLQVYQSAPMFTNGSEARPLPAGTIARHPSDTPGVPYAYQWSFAPVDGPEGVPEAAKIPLPIDAALIARGRERFNIYCSVCHGRLGNGNGMVVQRGFIVPPSFHNDRLSDPARTGDGHFYNVISNGYGAMFSYSERVAPRDRWAIAAYIRDLQNQVKQAAKDGRLTPQEYKALQGSRP
jgi:mono/diheme cytochrome c family protein